MRSLMLALAGLPSHGSSDPAPSRWAYRWQRWMLTPGFRSLVRIGLPLALLATIVSVWFSDAENRATWDHTVAQIRASIQDRPEFIVNAMAVDGADPALSEEVRAALGLSFPISSFLLDADVLRARLLELPPVADATVRVKAGGILEVAITPRVPVAVWRTAEGVQLLDGDGIYAGTLSARADRADLPLIAGDGVQDRIDEAVALFAAAAPIRDRVRGLVRMGERRWDMVLEGDQRILLPEQDPVRALERAIAVDAAQDLFDRDVSVIDMRLAARPTIRLRTDAVTALKGFDPSPEQTGASQ